MQLGIALLLSSLTCGISAPAMAGTACADKIGSCDYYLCRDSIQPCGDQGYFVRFGYGYCQEFMTEVRPKVSAQGSDWMPKIAACLQQAADDDISLDASCKQVQAQAIGTHPSCYKETGFCELPLSDKMKILETVYRELANPLMVEAMIKIEAECDL